jgi:hypothetical protein
MLAQVSQVKVSWIKAKPRSENPASNDRLFRQSGTEWSSRLSKGSEAPFGGSYAKRDKKRQAGARLEERLTNCNGLPSLPVRPVLGTAIKQ